jgi:hypothetical protein
VEPGENGVGASTPGPAGTIRWIVTASYGSTAAARATSDWVLRLHGTVRGDYIDGHGVAGH